MTEHQVVWDSSDLALLKKRGPDFFIKRAMQGVAKYQYLTGLMYYTGMMIEQDFAEAYKMFTIAARGKRYPHASFLLGSMFCKNEIHPGEGDPVEMAAQHFRDASEKLPAAACALGNIRTHENMRSKTQWGAQSKWKKIFKKKPCIQSPVSDDEAISNYEKSMAMKYAPSFYFMAIHVLNGWGCPIDIDRAFLLLDEGYQLGDKDCLWMKATLQARLHGVSTETIDAYEILANDGHREAQHAFGVACYDGSYRATDKSLAKTYLHRAAAMNFSPSQAFLSDIYMLEKDYKKAFEWGYRAYRSGEFTEKDLEKISRRMSREDRLLIPKIKEDNTEFEAIVDKVLSLPQ